MSEKMKEKGENGVEKKIQEISCEGDYKTVFADIFNFKEERLRREKNGEADPETGPMIMVLGGAQRGVNGGAGVSALEKAGLTEAFKTAIGVSTGAPALSYFLSKNAVVGNSIYPEENTGNEFINLRRGKDGKSIVDITWLCDEMFRKSGKRLDVDKVIKNKTDLFFALTDKNTGEGFLVDAKKLDDLIEGIRGSAAIPELYLDKVVLKIGEKEREVVDGSVAMPFPVTEALKKKPTSVLVFANRPKETESMLAKFLRKYESVLLGGELGRAILEEEERFQNELKNLRDSGIPYTIIWTDDTLSPLEKNARKLKLAGENYEKFVTEKIEESRLSQI